MVAAEKPSELALHGNVAENWRRFKQRLMLYLEAIEKATKPDKLKVAILLNFIGEEALEVFNTFHLKEDEAENFDFVINKFDDFCEPKKNVIFERFKFFSATQKDGESIDSFITELKGLSTSCEFESQKDSLIRDRIVYGIQDKALQERLLREPNLTLLKAIEMCKTDEISKQQIKIMQNNQNICQIRKYEKKHSPKQNQESEKEFKCQRICMDPRELNKYVQRERYILPTAETIFSELKGATVFSVFDASSAFWQVPLDKESTNLCTFATPFGRFRFKRLPYGLNSASEVFQRCINNILSGLQGTACYMDDILIYGNTMEEHNRNLETVLRRLEENNVKLNAKKQQIAVNKVNFLGHIISRDGIAIQASRAEAIQNLKRPENKTEVQRFLGMVTYLGKFIPNLSDKTAPLRKLISNKSEWKFGGEENDCFEKLKNMVSNAPILTFFDPTKPITISSDASQYGIGTVLMQGGQAIEYASFSLNATQRKYAQIEKELLAIVFGCERFQYYIWGNDVIVETDHKPLLSIVKKPLEKLSPRLQRMVLRLMRFQISLKFTPGKNMFVADHLSRDPLKDEVDTSYLEGQTESVHMLLVTTDEKIKRLQKETHGDHTLIQLIEYAKNGWPKYKTMVCDEAKPYWQFQDEIHKYEFKHQTSSPKYPRSNGQVERTIQTIKGLIIKAVKSGRDPNLALMEFNNTPKLGHRNIESIKKIRNENLARGLSLNNCSHSTDCVQCIQGKLTETPFPKKTEYRATETLQLVHSDICGPLPTNSLSGKRYFITFTDDYSRYTKIYLLKGKDEAYEKIKDYVISAHTEFGKNIQTMRTDNGREYVNRQVEDFLNQSGIKHQLTVPYSPAQNGVAERKNRSLMEMTRCMLFDSGLPQSLWAEAVTTANYLHNRIPSKATDKTPFELWTNRKPSLKHLKRFGCKAFAYIPKIKRNKLDSKVIEGIFLGYDDRSKGYRILHDTDNITISRSVKFIEKENGFHLASTKTTSPQVLSTDLTSSYHIGNAEESQEPGTQSENLEDSETEDYIQPSTTTGTQVVTQRRSTRPTKGIPPIRNDYMLYKTEAQDIQTPTSYSEVLQLPKIEREKWLQAMNEELNSLEKNNVWELTPLPKDKKIIGCKWTYKQKLNSKGEIERYKARLVAKGFNQKFGRDYEETFAPIVKHSTIRAFLAASVYKGMQVNHLDVKTAFLHGDLDKELYMELPEGLHTKQTNKVCKLKKAIYGLKQAGRSWNTKIASTLIKNNFKQSIVDPCLFTKNEENHSIYLILYVDDMLLASDSEIIIQNTVKTLEKEFEIKNLGDPTQFIGIEISRNREGELLLSQKSKIQELVERYNLQEAKPTFTPMESGYPGISDEKLLPNNVQYQQLIGSLLYLSVVSRPDIAAPVCILSSRNQNPRNCDWNAAKRIVRYLKTTKELELRISNQKPPTLEAYSDATWASDNTDRKSLSGNLFLLGSNPISWMTGKQGCVSLSSTEAELISAAEASQELLWLLDLLKDLELEQKAPIYFHQDNQSCLKICSSEKVSSRTKHIATKIHHLKDLQKKTVIKMIYCPTGDMKADLLTKPLPRPTFEKLRYNLVMSPHSCRGFVG
ncbi:hypothetical protein LAZ67_14002803 [Cordylochernes scorpioides]|uniref:Retrovirus-related Pol polyprotein from transposon TNT 1-94 n=1 Tax=Cordylochernes scorpioides TaxID=51811 RepID=A0ABY6LAR1_9ARAC|nr:hypothetical protein LAZ67_14002803 [Cordylochernes scorpioides]